MGQNLPLDRMSIEEKLKTMEEIWDDLVDHAESVPSPEWHKEVLDNRERAVREGTEEAIDWSIAKKELKKELKKDIE
jgi:hypothetical protein